MTLTPDQARAAYARGRADAQAHESPLICPYWQPAGAGPSAILRTSPTTDTITLARLWRRGYNRARQQMPRRR